jgi:predicted negative regulator of RcsB-dependent stress response
VLLAQGKTQQAADAFLAAWKDMPESLEYRRVVEAKLNSLGVAPAPAASGVSK